jgi:hypothetical protein
MDLLVLAKEPVPGRVKTRMCPPLSPTEAAALAEAALADTLDAASSCGADRVVLALDGRPGVWCPPGVVVVDQGGGPLERRLAAAWSHADRGGPALQIGMDTPQVDASALDVALAALEARGVDAVLGPAADGGWWALGMRQPDPSLLRGVPTSRSDTGRRQRARLTAAGLAVVDLWVERDLDTWADVVATGYRAISFSGDSGPATGTQAPENGVGERVGSPA